MISRPTPSRLPFGALGLVLGLALALSGCGDAFFHDPAPAGPSRIAVRFSQSSGGAQAAFDQADNLQLSVQDAASGEGLLTTSIPVSPAGGPIEASLDVELPDGATDVHLGVEVRRGSAPLFIGDATVRLTPGEVSDVTIPLAPVAASLALPSIPTFTIYGQSFALDGEVLFATGDVVPNAVVQWRSLTPGVVTVQSVGGGFRAVAQADGTASLEASYGSLAETVTAVVDATVVAIVVTPPSATVVLGQNAVFAAVLEDASGHPIAGRTVTWHSSNTDVASVDATGTATGHNPGTTEISATRDGVSGSATLTVRFPTPSVTTLPVEAIRLDGATARAQVDPRGAATLAWFQYGTDPGLSQFLETSGVSISASSGPVQLFRPIAGLVENTTYYVRAMADNSGGLAQGAIVSFRTLDAPNTPGGLSGTFVGGVLLTWLDTSDNETHFEIEREVVPPNGVATPTSGPARVFVPLATVGADVTSFEDVSPPTGELRYRVRACNNDGCSPFSPPLTWFYGLAPGVYTQTVGAWGMNSAVVRGLVNPYNAPTTAVFQVGLDPGFTTPPPTLYPTVPLQAGSGNVDVQLSTVASSLQPGTTYYVRIIATNAWGTSYSNIQTFTTLPGG